MAGEEVYTPQPTTASSPGISRPLLVGVGREMVDRAATVHRTMRYGASPNEGFVSTFLGLRQTKDEMLAFGGHKKNYFGSNWREKAYKYGPESVRNQGAILGTKYAPSSWLSAIDMADGRGNYGMMNIAFGRVQDADVMTNWDVTQGYKRARQSRLPNGRFGPKPEVRGYARNAEFTSSDTALTKGMFGYNQTINRFLGVGAAKSANVGRDLMLGTMFNANDVSMLSGYTGTGFKQALYRSEGAVGSALRRGGSIAANGGLAVEGASAAGLATRGAWMAGGLALRYFMYYDIARMAAKGAYKGWEAYNIKAPMAAYSMVGKQLLRPSFASGDASLLSGVPANNRMRAVQAIQGSRMNARNALGGEAALLAGHFG